MNRFLYTFIFLSLLTFLSAAPANPNPITFTQPDNSTFTGFVKGDEWQHWNETSDGFTFTKNERNEWVFVRSIFDGKYELTNILVDDGFTPSSILNIPKHIKPERNAPRAIENILDLQSISRTDFNIPMLLIEFPDYEAIFDVDNFNDMMNMDDYVYPHLEDLWWVEVDPYGITGSFREYFLEVSYGAFNPVTDVQGWYMAAENYLEYTGDDFMNMNMSKVREMIRDAVDDACADGMDFSQYDNDGDGFVDGVTIVHSGPGAENLGAGSGYIWSHKWVLGLNHYATECNGVIINTYTIQPELLIEETISDNSPYYPALMSPIGVYCHEFGHILGLPDLYDRDSSSGGIGKWGLMADGTWGGRERVGPMETHSFECMVKSKTRLGRSCNCGGSEFYTYT